MDNLDTMKDALKKLRESAINEQITGELDSNTTSGVQNFSFLTLLAAWMDPWFVWFCVLFGVGVQGPPGEGSFFFSHANFKIEEDYEDRLNGWRFRLVAAQRQLNGWRPNTFVHFENFFHKRFCHSNLIFSPSTLRRPHFEPNLPHFDTSVNDFRADLSHFEPQITQFWVQFWFQTHFWAVGEVEF